MDFAATALLESASASSANVAGKEMSGRHLAHRTNPTSRRFCSPPGSPLLCRKSDLVLLHMVPCASLCRLLDNIQEVLLATRLTLLFPAVLLMFAARIFHFS
jgi:Ca2+:H+ antiporter